jgi:hypothetical protein
MDRRSGWGSEPDIGAHWYFIGQGPRNTAFGVGLGTIRRIVLILKGVFMWRRRVSGLTVVKGRPVERDRPSPLGRQKEGWSDPARGPVE